MPQLRPHQFCYRKLRYMFINVNMTAVDYIHDMVLISVLPYLRVFCSALFEQDIVQLDVTTHLTVANLVHKPHNLATLCHKAHGIWDEVHQNGTLQLFHILSLLY